MIRKKVFITLLLLIFFFYNFAYSDFGYRSSKISIVVSESDLIFVGKVNKVVVTMSKYTSYIEVVEILKGSTGDKNIALNSNCVEALYYDRTYYEEVGDVKLLLNSYNINKELFSKEGRQDLVNLYPQFKGYEVKSRVIDDLEDLVD